MKKLLCAVLMATFCLFGCDGQPDPRVHCDARTPECGYDPPPLPCDAGVGIESCSQNTQTQNVFLTSLPNFDGQLSWGYPDLTSVSLDKPITRASYLRGGGKRGFFTFDISNIDWGKVGSADLILFKENSSLDEENSNYVVTIWETSDSDYANLRDCACGQISMSPPTFGCIPEGCGYPIEAPGDPLLSYNELATFTLEEYSPALGINSQEVLQVLKDNFQGKSYLTMEIGFQCSYNCLEGSVTISDGNALNPPTLIISPK